MAAPWSGRKECFCDSSGIVFNQLFGFYDKSGIVSGRRKFTISLAYSIFNDKSGSMPEGERLIAEQHQWLAVEPSSSDDANEIAQSS